VKSCSYCGKSYPDDATVCAVDGQPLIAPVVMQKKAAAGWWRFFGGGVLEPPLNEEQKVWIERSFQWLLGEFGGDCFLKHQTITPESSFFPDHYKGTEECVDKLVERVCFYMDVDPCLVEVEYFVDRDDIAEKHRTGNTDEYSGAAGLYFSKTSQEDRKKIAINVSQFKNPTGLVATIAHELGHVILLGGGKISREEKTHEYLTDLITVFFGLGIFTANSAFQFSQWQDHSHHGWSVSRSGYLSEEMFAYSLAAYAWMRGETKPQWSKYLAMNVRHYFNKSLKYLANCGQTSLRQLVSSKE
jgi:Zn-dependent peptidase ImmA (M78 family)